MRQGRSPSLGIHDYQVLHDAYTETYNPKPKKIVHVPRTGTKKKTHVPWSQTRTEKDRALRSKRKHVPQHETRAHYRRATYLQLTTTEPYLNPTLHATKPEKKRRNTMVVRAAAVVIY